MEHETQVRKENSARFLEHIAQDLSAPPDWPMPWHRNSFLMMVLGGPEGQADVLGGAFSHMLWGQSAMVIPQLVEPRTSCITYARSAATTSQRPA